LNPQQAVGIMNPTRDSLTRIRARVIQYFHSAVSEAS